MKTITQIATMAAFILTLLFMCGCSNDGPALKTDYGKLRIGRMDLSGAVSIGLKGQGNSSRAIDGEYLSAGLYKVDASGNISAVGVYFTTDTLGNRLEHEEALRVVPGHLFDLTDNYMLVVNCDYYDSDGDFVSNKYNTDENGDDHFIKQDVPYKDLLVRKSDGKIWCVDNIADMLYWYYYTYESYGLEGEFKEDSHGSLYFSDRGGYVYKFNLQESSSAFEQITANIQMFEDFFILDNGVVWSYRNGSPTSSLHIGWPHSGFQEITNITICDAIAGGLERTIPGGTFTSQYRKWHTDKITMKLEDPEVIFANYNNRSLAIVMSTASLIADEAVDYVGNYFKYVFFTKEEKTQIEKSLKESKWPVGLLFDIEIGSEPRSAKLNDNPIELRDIPNGAWKRMGGPMEYGIEFSSIYVGDGYILTSGYGNWITKIDLNKREWSWLKQLNFAINFSHALWLNGRIWSINSSRENFGAYWFDPVTLEDGFVKFNVELPSFFHLYSNADHYNGIVRNGRLTLQGVDPATGNLTTIVIDITTGEAISDTQAPEMLFETLINLN